MSAVGLSLLWAALQATLVGGVAIVLSSRPWRVGGAFTPLVALLAIGALTVCSFLPLPGWWPSEQFAAPQSTRPSPAAAAIETTESLAASGPITAEATEASTPTDLAPAPSIHLLELAHNVMHELKAVRSGSDPGWLQSSIPGWTVGMFALGAALGLSRLVLGVRGAWQIRDRSQPIDDQQLSEWMDVLCAQLGLRATIELRQADELSSAATLGYLSPTILLPSHWRTWNSHELQAVLAHELAHIHHRDFGAQLLAQLGLVLHFYNPIVHWLSERMKLEQELAADAVAARLAGGQQEYLRVLASLALDQRYQPVGWPARAFLPTRHSFLRRLEMLRVSKAPPAPPRLCSRLCALAVIALLTIGLITLRPAAMFDTTLANEQPAAQNTELTTASTAGPNTDAQAATVQDPIDTVNNTVPYELSYLGEDVEMVAGLRPASLMKSPQLKAIFTSFGQSILKDVGPGLKLEPEDVEQVVFGYTPRPALADSISITLKLTKPMKLEPAAIRGGAVQIGGRNAIAVGQGLVAWQPNEKTIVVNSHQRIERFMQGRSTYQAFAISKTWEQVKQGHAFALVSGKLARATPFNVQELTQIVRPIVDEAAYMALALSMNTDFQLRAMTECQDEQRSQRTEEAMSAAVAQLKTLTRDISESARAEGTKNPDLKQVNVLAQVAQLGSSVLEKSKSQVEGKLITVSMQLAEKDIPGELLGSITNATHNAAERQTSNSNLKQLGLAFHNYESTYKVLPQSACKQVSDKQTPKKYPYSWRVALLPYIEHAELYNKYSFDEPWDSPRNLELLKQMPAIYRHPSDPVDSTNTAYVVLVGATTMFPPDKPRPISGITDGLSNTIMAVEAKTSIPWTKPEDFEYDPAKPLPQLGGYSSEGYNVLTGNGMVRFFSITLQEPLLRKMITAVGGEPVK